MPFYFFVWSCEIEEHLAEHGIGRDDFETIVCNPDASDESRSTGRPVAFGWTADGRYVCCVFEMIASDTVLPVTAFEIEG